MQRSIWEPKLVSLLFGLAFLLLPAPLHAALQVEAFACTVSTAGATTTCTTGFQYKAVVIFTDMKTAAGESAGAGFGFGFSDGTRHVNNGWAGDDAVATTNVGRGSSGSTDNRAMFFYTNGAPTIATGGRITGVAFNATNMVLTFDATPSAAWLIKGWGIGGADITNVYVGHGTLTASTGTLSITDPAFQPDFLILSCARVGAQGTSPTVHFGLGAAISASKRWALSAGVWDGQTTSANVNGESKVDSTKVLVVRDPTTQTDGIVADFSGFTASGFDLNVSVTVNTITFEYLVIKGGSWDLGISTKPTTATAQTVSGSTISPALVGFAMSAGTVDGTYASNAITTLGVYDGTNQASAGAYHNDAINAVAKGATSSTAALHEMNATANMTGTSLNPDGWTGTWDATGTAYLVPWFTVGAPAAGGGLRIRKNVY